MNFQTLKDQVRAQAGIAVDDVTAGIWVNERYRQLSARAFWFSEEVSLGNTVNGQERYSVADDVVRIEELLVGSAIYPAVSTRQLYKLKAGHLALSFTAGTGVFAPTFSATGVESVALFPVPSSSGTAITAFGSVLPAALSAPTDVPVIPEDFHEYIRDGAIATGLALVDERVQEADRFETRYEFGVQQLGRRKNMRMAPSPVRAQLAGENF